jgi:hypothetical protein
MALTTGPRQQVKAKIGIAPNHLDPAAYWNVPEGFVDQKVATLIETEAFKVDSRQR